MVLLSQSVLAWRITVVVLVFVILIPLTYIAVKETDSNPVKFNKFIPRYNLLNPTEEEWEMEAMYQGKDEVELAPEEELQIVYAMEKKVDVEDIEKELGIEIQEKKLNTERTEKQLLEKDIVSYISLGDTGLRVKRYETYYDYRGPPPAIIFIHGGGWVTGKPDMSPKTFMNHVIGAVVFALDFRVEVQFPIQFNDCFRSTKYILEHTEELNINPDQIYIIGGSSGGNIAAAVTLALAQEPPNSFPKLKAQILINPLLQAIDFSTPSFQNNNSEISLITREKVIGMWNMYAIGRDIKTLNLMKANNHVPAMVVGSYRNTVLDHTKLPTTYLPQGYSKGLPGMNVDKELWDRMKDVYLDPRFAPLMADSFAGLPPTFIYVGFKDVVRDDAEFYVMQLKAAGVKVEYVMDMEGFHGSFWLHSPKQQEMYVKIAEFLKSL